MSVTTTMAPCHCQGPWGEQSQVDVMVGLMVGLYPSHLLFWLIVVVVMSGSSKGREREENHVE